MGKGMTLIEEIQLASCQKDIGVFGRQQVECKSYKLNTNQQNDEDEDNVPSIFQFLATT